MRNFLKCLLCFTIILCSLNSKAATEYWGNVGSGYFTNAANWSSSYVPTNGDAVFWTNSVSQTVTIDKSSITNGNVNVGDIGRPTTVTFNLLQPYYWNGTLTVGGGSTFVIPSGILSGTNSLYVGNLTSNNSLYITNGANLSFVGAMSAGFSAGGNSNNIVISGSGSTVSSSSFQSGTSGSFNSIVITNGAKVSCSTVGISQSSNSTGNVMVVSGGSLFASGSLQINNGGFGLNYLIINNSSSVTNSAATIGAIAGGISNTVLVSDSGTSWTNLSILVGGSGSIYNNLIVSNGATVYSSGAISSSQTAASSNENIIVTGSGSLMTAGAGVTIGSAGQNNSMSLLNGATLNVSSGNLIIGGSAVTAFGNILNINASREYSAVQSIVGNVGYGNIMNVNSGSLITNGIMYVGFGIGYSNTLTISDSGTLATNTQFNSGYSGSYNNSIVTNGATMYNSGIFYIGQNTSASNNSFIVTGIGSTNFNAATTYIGYNGINSSLYILNGGTFVSLGTFALGRTASSTGGSVLIDGANSMLVLSNLVAYVGTNSFSSSIGGTITVQNNGILEGYQLVSGISNSGYITNNGGIFQFTSSSPTITTNSANSIVCTNGTISYRAVSNCNITNAQVAKITFQDGNSFRLNASTNSYVPYDFSVNTPYNSLELYNTNPQWTLTNQTFLASGHLTVNNATTTLYGNETNSGTHMVQNGSVVTHTGSGTLNGVSTISTSSSEKYIGSLTVGGTLTIRGTLTVQ